MCKPRIVVDVENATLVSLSMLTNFLPLSLPDWLNGEKTTNLDGLVLIFHFRS